MPAGPAVRCGPVSRKLPEDPKPGVSPGTTAGSEPARAEKSVGRILQELHQRGMLLFTDPRRPSVTTLVAGPPIQGSWWGHPAGRTIYAVGELLEHQHHILHAKLLDGKITLLDDRLVPDLLRVASAGANWQLRGLDESTVTLRDHLQLIGVARVDRLAVRRSALALDGSSTRFEC